MLTRELLYKHSFGGNSIIKELNIEFGHTDIYYNGHLTDIKDTGHREIGIKFHDSQFPVCDLPDLLIMISEEIRFKLNRTQDSK